MSKHALPHTVSVAQYYLHNNRTHETLEVVLLNYRRVISVRLWENPHTPGHFDLAELGSRSYRLNTPCGHTIEDWDAVEAEFHITGGLEPQGQKPVQQEPPPWLMEKFAGFAVQTDTLKILPLGWHKTMTMSAFQTFSRICRNMPAYRKTFTGEYYGFDGEDTKPSWSDRLRLWNANRVRKKHAASIAGLLVPIPNIPQITKNTGGR